MQLFLVMERYSDDLWALILMSNTIRVIPLPGVKP